MPPVVVVRPLSGYVNRLQAIVSSAILAEELQAQLLVCWQESEVAPVPASAVLGAAWCSAHVRDAAMIREQFGVDVSTLPDYLQVDWSAGVLTLAGLDRGEQHFMPALRNALQSVDDLTAVVVSAGGKFTLQGDAALTAAQDEAFRRQRFAAYSELPLHPDIEARAAVAAAHQPFVGLHLRYSDRSTQTPWPHLIAPALRDVVARTGVSSVFVASDTAARRIRWTQRVADMGLTPWTADSGDYPRSDPRSALGALVDWRILTRSSAMVYFSASSFAEEAAVASGEFNAGIGLEPSPSRTAWVRAGQYAEAARTYPRRHGWWGRN